MDILRIKNLQKSFGGKPVINGLDLCVPEHCVYGFLGQNGAGKTTTMKMILGLLKPDGGEVTVCGEPVTYGETKTNRFIGYLPDVPEFYSYMTASQYLKLCGNITGLRREQITEKSKELLSLTGLADNKKRIGGYSRGMKQRLGIAQALLNEPRLLICDEPTSALDPLGRNDILTILHQIKEKTTVIFSTHILTDAERVCDRIAVLDSGTLAINGTLQELKNHKKHDGIYMEFYNEDDLKRFCADKSTAPMLSAAKTTGHTLHIKTGDIRSTQATIIDVLSRENIQPIKLEVLEPTLENLFMEAVK